MAFGAGAYLLGFLGIMVPIAIHLLSQNTRNTIELGSIRFLKETDTKTLKSIMPSQWLLLLLRSLIVGMVVLIMAEMLLPAKAEGKKLLVLIDPAYQHAKWITELTDSIQSDILWITDGLPAYEVDEEAIASTNWLALSKLNLSDYNSVLLLSPMRISELEHKILPIDLPFRWITPSTKELDQSVLTIEKEGIAWDLLVESNEQRTRFEWHEADSGSPEHISIGYYVDEDYSEQQKKLTAAVRAIDANSNWEFEVTNDTSDCDWLIWLSSQTPPLRQQMITLTNGNLRALGHGIWTLGPETLDMQNMLSSQFLLHLEDILTPQVTNLAELDQRQIPEEFIQTKSKTITVNVQPMESAASWLWIGLLALLIIERTISYRSK